MKIKIEKLPHGVRISLETDTAKKPLEFVLPPTQVELVCQMLKTAVKADAFRFEFET